MDRVYYYLNDAKTYYLATIDGNKPRVRPFGTILLDEGKLYIQTGKVKDVSKQIGQNPNVEICACMNDGTWLRIEAELAEDDSHDVKVKMLDKMPSLKNRYSPDDGNMQMFYLKNATAVFSSFTAEPETITF
ncbi:MAG: pyridoxamine 5'-phosphate oxidase family protein [Blautia sp.]|nr:pyridoxamine 5'-phosphate oxidase family protein [Blautia sp.]